MVDGIIVDESVQDKSSEIARRPLENSQVCEHPRQSLIDLAVKFLQNSSVIPKPDDQKKEFLRKKGLTENEIDIAFNKANTSYSTIPLMPIESKSTFTKIKDFSTVTLLIGGVLYALHAFYKKFISPLFIQFNKSQAEHLDQIESQIGILENSFNSEISELFQKQEEIIQEIKQVKINVTHILSRFESSNQTGGDVVSLLEPLRSDIKSLKNRLLSANQFPANPIKQPIIPTWQLEASTESSFGLLTDNDQNKPLSEISTELETESSKITAD